MADAAVIFDVDGVLLELTRAEEDVFFRPFAKYCDESKLSRDWNSYKIRNDEDITKEICAQLNIKDHEKITQQYLSLLRVMLQNRHAFESHTAPFDERLPDLSRNTVEIEGAGKLLQGLAEHVTLGIATANFRQAAELRLAQAGLWPYVETCAFGADGGGHKHEILSRALNIVNLPKSRIVYIGDNLNDVEAGLLHGVHFIGFSTSQKRLEDLKVAGAKHLSSNHITTRHIINAMLNL